MKKRANPPGVVPRLSEEIERVIRLNPGLSIRDMSKAIGMGNDFLYNVVKQPDRYILAIADLNRLNVIYGIDDIYVIKGLRYKAVLSQYEDTKARLSAIITLLNQP